MNKEEILAKSRNDNKDGDERVKNQRSFSSGVAFAVGEALCLILAFIEQLVFDRSSAEIWVIASGMLFSALLTQAIKLKEKYYILSAVAFGIWFFSKLAVYIMENLR